MKTTLSSLRSTSLVILTLAGASAVSFSSVASAASITDEVPNSAGIDSRQNTKAVARAVAAEAKAIVGESWEKVKEATYEQRATVRSTMTTAEAALDLNILEWTARKDALAAATRPAANTALEEVRNSREVLRQKINSLDNVTVETWTSVMGELDSAWQRVRSAAGALAVRLERTS